MSTPPHRMQLVGVAMSPRTERALWALDHHSLAYDFRECSPGSTPLWVRVFARQPFGPVTLPVLRHGGHLVSESFQIAQHAEREGARERLIPDVTAIVQWNELSNRLIAAGENPLAARTTTSDVQRAVLEAVRERLGKGRYLVRGQFSYADIAIAAALGLVLPRDDQSSALSAPSRATGTNAEAAREFADVFAWRDEIYRSHRRLPEPRTG